MMKVIPTILIFLMLYSCHSAHEIVGYEFSQTKQDGSHWADTRTVNVIIQNRDSFSVYIIDGNLYGNSPLADTITIDGKYIKRGKVYFLEDPTDKKVYFKMYRDKNKVWFKGTYYNKSKSSYSKIRNKSEF